MQKNLRLLPLFLALPLFACRGEPEAAFQVGEVGFPAEQVSGLSAEQLHTLADLTAFVQAVARDATGELGEPIVEREAERSRLAALPAHLAAEEMGLGEEALRAAYEAAPEWELEVRHVVRLVPRWASAAERQEARQVIEEVQRRAAAGEDFAALAGEFSEEPGAAERGGLLQPGRQGSWVPPFWDAALALQPGEISAVVETEYGYHVLKLEARRPVPFPEANRARIRARLVPEPRARAAMERWVAEQSGELVLEPPAMAAARRHLGTGSMPDTLILARWTGGEYSAWQLALYRASLEPEARAQLDAADDSGFGWRVESDAREAMWSQQAGEMGVEQPPDATAAAERGWEQRAALLARAVGARAGMREEEIRSMALRALGGTGQELRIARQELFGLRPLLRRFYPVSGAAAPAPPSSAAASSSDNP
ncbi:MAG: peptidyl-prolyl cis-trans isomerase [Gemmatimonadetes bacterium]|nr:peptidyl-prolyl cis-trans isomerase [Gemmatimonadota bacterium]